MKNILALAVFLLLSLSAIAADEEVRYYDVELILFENLEMSSRQSELWPTSVERTEPEPETVVEINSPYPGQIPKEYDPAMTFKSLPKDKYRLAEAIKKLEDSPSRRVLLHTAWRQPGMDWDNALNVHLKKSIPAVSADAAGSETPAVPQASRPGQAGELEGYIKVILSRYLHVDTDIIFQTRPKTDRFDFYIDEGEEPTVYRLNQLRRRIRSTELHYLDHPVVGMLIAMYPVETDKVQ